MRRLNINSVLAGAPIVLGLSFVYINLHFMFHWQDIIFTQGVSNPDVDYGLVIRDLPSNTFALEHKIELKSNTTSDVPLSVADMATLQNQISGLDYVFYKQSYPLYKLPNFNVTCYSSNYFNTQNTSLQIIAGSYQEGAVLVSDSQFKTNPQIIGKRIDSLKNTLFDMPVSGVFMSHPNENTLFIGTCNNQSSPFKGEFVATLKSNQDPEQTINQIYTWAKTNKHNIGISKAKNNAQLDYTQKTAYFINFLSAIVFILAIFNYFIIKLGHARKQNYTTALQKVFGANNQRILSQYILQTLGFSVMCGALSFPVARYIWTIFPLFIPDLLSLFPEPSLMFFLTLTSLGTVTTFLLCSITDLYAIFKVNNLDIANILRRNQ